MLKSFGIEGSIRVSPIHCHSIKDIEKFLKITGNICNHVKKNKKISKDN